MNAVRIQTYAEPRVEAKTTNWFWYNTIAHQRFYVYMTPCKDEILAKASKFYKVDDSALQPMKDVTSCIKLRRAARRH